MEKIALPFQVLGQLVSIDVTPLPAMARLDEALPVLRALDDQLVAIAVSKHREPVSCARGCSACCRIQPVPVTPAEAYGLLRLVEELPEPKRGTILARFADREARLASAGLIETYLRGRPAASEEEAKSNASAYLNLRLPCPFLEPDESCGIYAQRPFVCREYCVTSDKQLCDDPLAPQIKTVPVIASMAKVNLETSAVSAGMNHTIPLTLALAYARDHREELERTHPGTDLLGRTIRYSLAAVYRNLAEY